MYQLRTRSPLGGSTTPRPVFRRLSEADPVVQVVDLAKLKSHLRITHAVEDTYLTDLIPVATLLVERYLSRRLISRAATMTMDVVPGIGSSEPFYGASGWPVLYANGGTFRGFEVLGTPVSAWTDLAFVGQDGASTVVDASSYLVDFADQDMPARVVLKNGSVWPSDTQAAKGIVCRYTLGYGPAAANVPTSLRHGVLLAAGALYSNRGDAADSPMDILDLPGIRACLAPYRVMAVSTLS